MAERFMTMDALAKASKEEIVAIETMGETIADSLSTYFNSEGANELLEELKSVGVNI